MTNQVTLLEPTNPYRTRQIVRDVPFEPDIGALSRFSSFVRLSNPRCVLGQFPMKLQ